MNVFSYSYRADIPLKSGNEFTSKEIVKAIISNPQESRKELFLEYFSKAA